MTMNAHTILCTLFACATVVCAQQMAIDRAMESYEKRLVAAEKNKAAETAKVNKTYEDTTRRINDDFSNRVKAALRTTKDEDEAAKLQTLLAAVAGGDSEGSSGASAPKNETTAAEFDKLFDQLAGTTWHGIRGVGASDARGKYNYVYTYEFKHPKLLVYGTTRFYENTRESDRFVKNSEYRARLRDGKIVFESVNTRSTVQYEIAIPFDATGTKLTVVHRSVQSNNQNREETMVLTKSEK